MTAEAPEYVTNVVLRLDTLLKGAIPALNETSDNGDPRVVDVINGDAEAVLVG